MEIEKAAVAGTLESSDCMVTVEDGDGNIDLVLESTVFISMEIRSVMWFWIPWKVWEFRT